MEKVTIKMYRDGKLGTEAVDAAYVIGDFAVISAEYPSKEPLKFSITHIPSGMNIPVDPIDDLNQAKCFADLLDRHLPEYAIYETQDAEQHGWNVTLPARSHIKELLYIAKHWVKEDEF